MKVRRATPDDAPSIVALMRDGFDPDVLNLTVYACHGVTDYLMAALSLPCEHTGHHFIVAEADGDVVGFIEYVHDPGSTLLTYAAVRPDYRGRRIGTTLFREAVASGGSDVRHRVALDVIDENHRSADWYYRLGFVAERRTGWWRVDAPTGLPGDAVVVGYPQAEAVQARFGFSELRVKTSAGLATIGRLGDRLLRITDPTVLDDGAVWAAVRAVEPRRSDVLVRAPLESLDGEATLRTTRMSSTASALLPHLPA